MAFSIGYYRVEDEKYKKSSKIAVLFYPALKIGIIGKLPIIPIFI
jgi:hypothetical protein